MTTPLPLSPGNPHYIAGKARTSSRRVALSLDRTLAMTPPPPPGDCAAGGALALLAALGFDPNEDPKTGMLTYDPHGKAVPYLRFMIALFPACCHLILGVLMGWYQLDRESHEKVVDQLQRRRAGEVFEVVDPLPVKGRARKGTGEALEVRM